MIKGFNVKDAKISGKLILNDNKTIKLQVELKDEVTCPECKSGKIIKGKTAWGCSNYKGGCSFRIPFICEA